MRIVAVASAVLLSLLSPAAAPASSKRVSPRRCPQVGSRALLADAQAEVYEAKGLYEPEIFACAYASGHAYSLGAKPSRGTSSGGGGTDKVALAGTIVAYEQFIVGGAESGPAESRWDIIVRNLGTGRRLQRLATTGSFVEDLLVKPDGSAAWIVNTRYKPSEYAVVAVDKTGTRTLATGPDIMPSSLASVGSILYWTQGGRAVATTFN